MAFWAKTSATDPDDYLDLISHMADVGEVAGRVWDVALTDELREWWCGQMNLPDAVHGRSWVTFVAAIHDIGKANPAFQLFVSELATRLLPDDLAPDITRRYDKIRHDAVSGAILAEWLGGSSLGLDCTRRLAATISGHHSAPRPYCEIKRAKSRILQQAERWQPEQLRITNEVAERFHVQLAGVPSFESNSLAVLLAGFVTLSDWVGSDATRFPVTAGLRSSSAALAAGAIHAPTWGIPDQPEPANNSETLSAGY